MMPGHVLHAGDGYTYLTRQVASGDHQPPRCPDAGPVPLPQGVALAKTSLESVVSVGMVSGGLVVVGWLVVMLGTDARR